MADTSVTVTGLEPLIRELRGPMMRDANKELRSAATAIAKDLVPVVAAAVAQSGAPQAAAMAGTVRAHSDRIPVIVIGKVNPRLTGFTRRGTRRDGAERAPVKIRRGALAYGVVYGPAGGRRDTPIGENYYRIGRDARGGPVGRALAEGGAAFDAATDAYLRAFADVMRRHGFIGQSVKALSWNGKG